MTAPKDYTGETFNRLFVAERFRKNGRTKYRCECECGNEVIAEASCLIRGRIKSCGCFKKEQTAAFNRATKRTHGQSYGKGGNGTLTYISWNSMILRCYYESQPGYKSYGGKGIVVCDRWRNSFEAFLEDMGERVRGTSIERIDRNGNYEPGNCRWATSQEQANNKSNNRPITFNGETLNLNQWARKVEIGRSIISKRLEAGWSVEDALTRPVRVLRRKKEDNQCS